MTCKIRRCYRNIFFRGQNDKIAVRSRSKIVLSIEVTIFRRPTFQYKITTRNICKCRGPIQYASFDTFRLQTLQMGKKVLFGHI